MDGRQWCPSPSRGPWVPKNAAAPGITTYFQPSFAGDFCSLTVKVLFIGPGSLLMPLSISSSLQPALKEGSDERNQP